MWDITLYAWLCMISCFGIYVSIQLNRCCRGMSEEVPNNRRISNSQLDDRPPVYTISGYDSSVPQRQRLSVSSHLHPPLYLHARDYDIVFNDGIQRNLPLQPPPPFTEKDFDGLPSYEEVMAVERTVLASGALAGSSGSNSVENNNNITYNRQNIV